MGRFNLIDEPWISVIADKTGQTQEVSLTSLFENAHLYKRIAGDTATQDFAVLRVALAVLHTVFSRFDAKGKPYGYFNLDERFKPLSFIDDEDDLEDYTGALYRTWEMLWHSGQFPQIVIEYLQKWHDRFYLLDDKYPFFQVVAADIAPENIKNIRSNNPTTVLGRTINRLVSESGNKIALFSPKTDNNKSILSPSECARWLLTFQGYTGVFDKAKFRNHNYNNISKGWLFDIGGLFLEGNNLFETLMLNLVLLHPEPQYQGAQQNPCWEYSSSEMIQYYFSGHDYDNLAALYTDWSRAIYIDPDINFREPFRCDIVKLPAIKQNDNFIEPMTLWQFNKSGSDQNTYTPRKHQVNQAIWRSFGLLSLPSSSISNQRQPGIIAWLNTISPIIEDYYLTLRAISMKYEEKDTKSRLPVDEVTDQLSINDFILADIKESGWVPRISDVVEETKKVVESTFRTFLLDIKEIRKIESILFVNEEVERLYFQINQPFNQWLSALKPSDSKDERIFEWRAILKKIVLQQAEQLVKNAGPRDYTGIVVNNKIKNIATIYNSFLYFLNQQLQ